MASSDSLAYIESVDANSLGSPDTPLAALRASAKVAAERGHPAESFARTAGGRILTPDRFGDIAFDAAVDARRWAAARNLEASRWGAPRGADYVSNHWMAATAVDPVNFSVLESPSWALPYASAPGDSFAVSGAPFGVYGSTVDLRLTPDGATAITLQFCRDPTAPWLQTDRHCLLAHDLDSGRARLITRLPDEPHGLGDLSISADGRYLIAGFPMPELVDIRTGHRAGLGRQYRAATWYPQGGASAVLAVTGENDAPPWHLVVIDLATFNVQDVAVLPRRVDGIQVARDGAIAARMRPEEGHGRLDELVVAADTGSSFEPVVPVRSASGWLRRLSRPRWIERRPSSAEPVTLHGPFEEFMRKVPPGNGVFPGETDWALDAGLSRIRHRAGRLRVKGASTDVILAQLVALTSLPAQFDRRIASEIAGQVAPVARAAAATREGIRLAQTIADVAAGRQPPSFPITFGD